MHVPATAYCCGVDGTQQIDNVVVSSQKNGGTTTYQCEERNKFSSGFQGYATTYGWT